jgi:hypothetical protein
MLTMSKIEEPHMEMHVIPQSPKAHLQENCECVQPTPSVLGVDAHDANLIDTEMLAALQPEDEPTAAADMTSERTNHLPTDRTLDFIV